MCMIIMSLSDLNLKQSSGVSRFLTHEFKQFRRDFKLRGSRFREIPPPENEYNLPPAWVDVYENLLEDLKHIESLLQSLEQSQNFRLAKAFGDTSKMDKDIRSLCENITQKIRESGQTCKTIENSPQSDAMVRKNVSQGASMKLQALTVRFKRIQHKYIAKLQQLNDSGDILTSADPIVAGFFEDEVIEYEEVVQRDQGINQLVKNMNDLAEIFRELSALVVHQGTILDRIDYNVSAVVESTSKANEELKKAEEHQKCARSAICILILIVLIIILGAILALKHI